MCVLTLCALNNLLFNIVVIIVKYSMAKVVMQLIREYILVQLLYIQLLIVSQKAIIRKNGFKNENLFKNSMNQVHVFLLRRITYSLFFMSCIGFLRELDKIFYNIHLFILKG